MKAKFDGYPYRAMLANMGTGCHIIIIRKDIRAAIGKQAGHRVEVELELDTDERMIEVPEELQMILNKNKKAKAFFDSLSYTNRKAYVVWITSAKKQETKSRRIQETLAKLLSGMKNPSA